MMMKNFLKTARARRRFVAAMKWAAMLAGTGVIG